MKVANLAGRLVLVEGLRALDVHTASGGTFEADPQRIFDRWDEFAEWARQDIPFDAARSFTESELEAPVPLPGQIFAIGLNYADHAAEGKVAVPTEPTVFTKFSSSIAAPVSTVRLPPGDIDWEAELVAVIGRTARNVNESDALEYVAGFTVGQDLSNRTEQFTGPVPQWSLAKSHENFSPLGPVIVTVDELDDPLDLEIGCSVDGEVRQLDRTSSMVFPVPFLVAYLSRVVTLRPGDLIFTGTPSGVGLGRVPPRYLKPGEELVSWVQGIGSIRQTFVS